LLSDGFGLAFRTSEENEGCFGNTTLQQLLDGFFSFFTARKYSDGSFHKNLRIGSWPASRFDVEESNFYKKCQKPEPTAPSIGQARIKLAGV
jgi:hypothetical protein